MLIFYIIFGSVILYLILTLYFTYLVHQFPRKPVHEIPDWGKVIDTLIPAKDKGSLEIWRIEPERKSKGIIVLAHGWSRNRDRMISRARIFGNLDYTTVIHSAQDHGNSSPRRFMNASRFAEDIEAVLDWLNEPVILYGHSAGAAGAIIAAHRNPDRIKLLFLEGCYADTKKALLSLYRHYNLFFGVFFAPMVLFWMEQFYRKDLDSISPARLAPDIDIPVMLIHGEKDESFPLDFAKRLKESFTGNDIEMFVAKGSDHSHSSLDPKYPVAVKSFLEKYAG